MTAIDSIDSICKKYNDLKIYFSDSDIRDNNHLSAIWYGGEVATISYKGFTISFGSFDKYIIDDNIGNTHIRFGEENCSGEFYYIYGDSLDDNSLNEVTGATNLPRFSTTFQDSNGEIVDVEKLCSEFDIKIKLFSMDIAECFNKIGSYIYIIDRITSPNDYLSEG